MLVGARLSFHDAPALLSPGMFSVLVTGTGSMPMCSPDPTEEKWEERRLKQLTLMPGRVTHLIRAERVSLR